MLLKRSDESYERLKEILSGGGVAIMACDTIYGFVGKVPSTEDRIRRIKGRGETKPFLQLLPDAAALETTGALMPEGEILSLWPGPFTFVFAMKDGGTTAFRVPEDAKLRELTASAGCPLYSTSVNRAGEPPMDDPSAILDEFGREVDLVEDAGIFEGRSPSTVVDVSSRPYRILRQGAGVVPEDLLI